MVTHTYISQLYLAGSNSRYSYEATVNCKKKFPQNLGVWGRAISGCELTVRISTDCQYEKLTEKLRENNGLYGTTTCCGISYSAIVSLIILQDNSFNVLSKAEH